VYIDIMLQKYKQKQYLLIGLKNITKITTKMDIFLAAEELRAAGMRKLLYLHCIDMLKRAYPRGFYRIKKSYPAIHYFYKNQTTQFYLFFPRPSFQYEKVEIQLRKKNDDVIYNQWELQLDESNNISFKVWKKGSRKFRKSRTILYENLFKTIKQIGTCAC